MHSIYCHTIYSTTALRLNQIVVLRIVSTCIVQVYKSDLKFDVYLGSSLGELDGPPTPNWGRSPNWGPIGGFFVGELDFQKNVGGFYNPPTPNWGIFRWGARFPKKCWGILLYYTLYVYYVW